MMKSKEIEKLKHKRKDHKLAKTHYGKSSKDFSKKLRRKST
jgi:hypothetical protein